MRITEILQILHEDVKWYNMVHDKVIWQTLSTRLCMKARNFLTDKV